MKINKIAFRPAFLFLGVSLCFNILVKSQSTLIEPNANNGILSKNNAAVITSLGSIPLPASGSGTRLMWIPAKSAFRVGTVTGTQWDASNIGTWSFATGYNNIASGVRSTAMGSNNTVSSAAYNSIAMGGGNIVNGSFSIAMGVDNVVNGNNSTAMGATNTTGGEASTAMGQSTSATGNYSTTMGYGTSASNNQATAIGYYATASANTSFAVGYYTTASGERSTAIGSLVSTNNRTGAFVIGDRDPYFQGTTSVGSDNEFVARFANGYYLLTCGDTGTGNPSNNIRTGVRVGAGQNAWSTISDSTKKEKFLAIDGEALLHKIAKFKLSTWNYKGQDPKIFRHYGPMAQDFYAAFGRDAYGTIGCDTLINQADFDGINFTAIQALVKRTEALKAQNEELTAKNETLIQKMAKMERDWAEMKEFLAKMTASNQDPTVAVSPKD